jgi:DNA mismatch repair protein MutS
LGIKTLKVSFSRAFGYFIEVSRGQAEKMPPSFMRRQTLVNAERFISPELKSFEEKVLSAESKIKQLEEKLFIELKEKVSLLAPQILQSAKALAVVDLIFSLAQLAVRYRYVRPQLHRGTSIFITRGRHPIAELYQGHAFVPNDFLLDSQESSLMILTGPNMAGKSTYIRQQALLTLLAHIGSFIPASAASIGLVDRIFSRVGASDDLGAGQSTFMVEMAETAAILNQATKNSLIILDEIGRGTSTYDGISLAWAIIEYLLQNQGERPKTLFATHYYELTALEAIHAGVKNYAVAISEVGNAIEFLYKIIPGKADKSYGLHVAKLAGIPPVVIERAEEILHTLESKENKLPKVEPSTPQQTPTIQATTNTPIDTTSYHCLEFIKKMDLSNLSPIECFLQIHKLKNDIDKLSSPDLLD